MLSNTNNYNNLTNTLSRLNNADSGKLNHQQQSANTSGASGFANNVSGSTNSNNAGRADFMSSFGGFQQQLGQRYSMSESLTVQLLQMFVMVLAELVGDVIGNSSQHNAQQESKGSQSPAQSSGNQDKQNAAGHSGRADTSNSVSSSSVGAPDSTSAASGNEAAQVHKNGGCPFTAMESEQGNNSGGNQSVNSANPANAANSANAPASNQNNTPVTGAAGPAGQQGNLAVGGSSAVTTPVKPVGHPSAVVDSNQPAQDVASVDKADNRAIDYTKLSNAERSDMGLDDRERAVVHLWGRQMVSAGEQNGGIYTNVLGADGTGANWSNKEEVALVQELRAQENAKFGTDTGWLLDEAYFEIMKDKTGVDMSARYADRPVHESNGPIVISNDINALEERTGLSGFEQGVMRLMGHDALMDGEFDGSVLEYTVGNANSLDSNQHSDGNAVDDVAQTLLAQDKADDGEVNGSSIMHETIKTLDRLFA